MPPRRLILTSSGLDSPELQAEFTRMLGGPADGKTVWYLPTAALRDVELLQDHVNAVVAALRNSGFWVKVIDVEYVKGDELKKAIAYLGRIDVIYADCGNSYSLRHHLRNSGGDQLVYDALDAGAIYVGVSAGSIVAGQTIQTAFWKDWDDRTAQGTISVNWKDKELARGLDLGNGRSFFPHANGHCTCDCWQEFQAWKHGHTDHEVIKMADGDGFIIDGDKAYPVVSQRPHDDEFWTKECCMARKEG